MFFFVNLITSLQICDLEQLKFILPSKKINCELLVRLGSLKNKVRVFNLIIICVSCSKLGQPSLLTICLCELLVTTEVVRPENSNLKLKDSIFFF